MTDKLFLKVAGVAAIISALTTVGVHYISFPADSFDERLLLSGNTLYIAHRWMIIFHCVFVITSMLGIALLKHKDNKGFITLGFLFYTVFGVAEMTRMFSVLQYLNGLRTKYLETTDEMVRNMLQQSMEHFPMAANTLFVLFAFSFGLANLCYGIVVSSTPDKTRWIGYGFLYWASTSFLGLANEFFHAGWIDHIMEYNGKVFQPVFRLIIGAWILKMVRSWNK